MTGVAALLAGSALVGFHGHRPLLWLGERRVDPTILLTAWTLSAVGLVASTVATVTLLALPSEAHPATGIFRLAGGCWTALAAGSVPGSREAVAALSVAVSIGIVFRLAWAIARRLRQRREQAPHLERLRLVAAGTPSDQPLWVRDDRPLAVSIGGRRGMIVMSDGLRRQLTVEAVAATLEHERAHLRGRHHAMLAVVEVLAAALPFFSLLRTAPIAIKDLIELAADAQAARRCGPAAVREALCRLTGQPVPAHGLGMAGRLTQTRLLRLTVGSVGEHRVVRVLGCTVAVASALVLPAATGWLAINVVGCVVA